MQSLAGYGSDSDSGSPPPQAAPSTSTAGHHLPPVAVEADDQDEDYDPTDAFGLKQVEREAKEQHVADAAAAGGSGQHQQVERITKSAPEVIASGVDGGPSSALVTRPSDNVIFYNASYADLSRPVQGPKNPWDDGRLERQNALTGHVEQQHFSAQAFAEQQRSFHVLGYAANPSIAAGQSLSADGSTPGVVSQFVGNVHAAYKAGGAGVSDVRPTKRQVKEVRRKRKAKGNLGEFDDPDSEAEEEGAAAEGGEGEDGPQPPKKKKEKKDKPQREYIGPWAGWEGESMAVAVPTEEEYEEQELNGGKLLNKEERRKKALEDANSRQVGFGEEKSVFHGKETHDYLGRTYLHIPSSAEILLPTAAERLDKPRNLDDGIESFVPKKCIHTWSGHTKGVSRIQLFPTSGHLLLSASLDTRIKLWDIYREGKCLRTFMGHSKAVHDVTFNNGGDEFLSAAFDRQMKLWDTETGQCKQAFSNGKIPYCIKFHPEQQSTFLAGMSDKKVVQYDIRSGEITQEYNQHLGPVNTITFVDENRRFVTTSDDKTMRVWDFDIPVPIKLIADPAMHSMPAVGLHPNGKWLAATSLDNQVVLFGADTFKQNRKKRFAGHTIAGYACEPRFSPDGRFLSSGDGVGNMVFWDFKTSRIVGRLNKAHKQVIISHEWLPHETSKLITSSWDGLIKLWD
ncbi:hypothetical protein JCM11251_001360 [Rhodosporidiobolus azoricus]